MCGICGWAWTKNTSLFNTGVGVVVVDSFHPPIGFMWMLVLAFVVPSPLALALILVIVVPDGIDVDLVGRNLGLEAAAAATAFERIEELLTIRPRPAAPFGGLAVIVIELAIVVEGLLLFLGFGILGIGVSVVRSILIRDAVGWGLK